MNVRDYICEAYLSEGLRGEWWIQDGTPTFADGDTGDMNHEMYAIETARSNMITYLGLRGVDDDAEPDEIMGAFRDLLKEEGGLTDDQVEAYDENPKPFILKALHDNHDVARELKFELHGIYSKFSGKDRVLNWFYECAFEGGDARDFALVQWGWKRMKGNWLETYTLTRDDLKDIARGIGEIVDEDGSEEPLMFNLEVRSNGKVFEGVPLEVLEDGNPAKLMAYHA